MWKSILHSFTVRLVLGFVAAAASLAVIGLLTPSLEPFDKTMRALFQGFALPRLTIVMRSVTQLGSTWVLTGVAIVSIVFMAFRRCWRDAGLFLLTMVGQIVLHHGFKFLFARQRPQSFYDYIVSDSYSFPSGHALASASTYGILAYLISNRIDSLPAQVLTWVLALTLIFLIGFSRLYFGLHHASDVIAGYVAAMLWTATVASGARSD